MSDLKGLVGKEQAMNKYIKGLYLHDLQKAGCSIKTIEAIHRYEQKQLKERTSL